MAAPNIVSVSSIIGKTAVASSVDTTGVTIISSVATGHVLKLNSVVAVNKTGSAAHITVSLVRSATEYRLAYQISVPANASLLVVGKDSAIYLEESDALKVVAGTAAAIDVIASYEDIS